jgi:hypothetical protein
VRRHRSRRRRPTRNQKLAASTIGAGLLLALAHGHAPAAAPASPSAVSGGGNEALANSMAAAAPYHWTGGQTTCLDWLWTRESNFEAGATNPQSGAYGIPQSLPAGKMAAAGEDWQTNPATQIRWGLSYIRGTYGTPCGAWSHEQAAGWY